MRECEALIKDGWTMGGGLEWMFAPGWSVFGDYNCMDFGRKSITYIVGRLTIPGSVGDIRSTRDHSTGSGRRQLQVQLGRPGRRPQLIYLPLQVT
jgi:hypothetical protein